MKKLNVLFLSLFALVIISSCSNDDDNSTSASIVGTWEYYQEGDDLDNLELWEHESIDCGKDYIKIQKQATSENTYSLESGYFYKEDSECIKETSSENLNITDNKIIVSDDYETVEYTIEKLTETTLTIKEVDEEGTWYTVYKRK